MRPTPLPSLGLALLLALSSSALASPKTKSPAPDVVFSERFLDTGSVSYWTPGGVFDNGSVRILSHGPQTTTVIRRNLPLTALAGRTAKITAKVKADGVTHPPGPLNGIKLRLDITGSDGKTDYPQAHIRYEETMDWREIQLVRAIPSDATKVALSIGIERVEGTVWFDDIQVEVLP